MGADLRLFDEMLSKTWRTEVVDDNMFRLSAGDVMQGSVERQNHQYVCKHIHKNCRLGADDKEQPSRII